MRIIDADALKSATCVACGNGVVNGACYNGENCTFIDIINEQPTIEPEVRRGRWILCEDQHGVDNDNNNYAYFCSQCHYQDVHSKYAKVNFCWNCGADMREEGADNA